MKTRITRDRYAEDNFCWFMISPEQEHNLLDIEDVGDITDDALIAQARAQGVVGQIDVVR